MRKVIVFNQISVDGYFAGPNGETDWFSHDPEVGSVAHQMMHPDTVLFGRVTYQMFEAYWPQVSRDPQASSDARQTAKELDEMTKVVFSRTLEAIYWKNTRLVSSSPVEEVRRLKAGVGPDITIFGSGTIVHQLAAEGLIDEYLLPVTPVVLGAGKPLFGSGRSFQLKLLGLKVFDSGSMLLHYGVE